MDSSEFLEQLRERLLDRGVDPKDAEVYVEQFGRYFDNISEEDLSEQMASLGNIDTIVSNLIELIEAKKAKRSAQTRSDSERRAAEAAPAGDGEAGTYNAEPGSPDITDRAAEPQCGDAEAQDNTTAFYGAAVPGEAYAQVTPSSADMPTDGSPSPVTGAPSPIGTDSGIGAVYDVGAESDTDAEYKGEATSYPDASRDISTPVGIGTESVSDSVPRPAAEIAGAGLAQPARAPARVLRGNTRVGRRAEPEEFLINDAATNTREFDAVPDGFERSAYEEAYRAAATRDGRGEEDEIISGTVYRSVAPDYGDEYDGYRPGIREYIYRGLPLEKARLETPGAKKAFYGTVLGSLPLSLPAALLAAIAAVAVFALDGALFLGLALSIVGLSAVGTAFTLVSIIYGITQLGSALPVALYEIGIGIMSAGIAIGACILIYNFLVRVMPYTFKYLVHFSTYLLYRLKCIVYRFREECAKR